MKNTANGYSRRTKSKCLLFTTQWNFRAKFNLLPTHFHSIHSLVLCCCCSDAFCYVLSFYPFSFHLALSSSNSCSSTLPLFSIQLNDEFSYFYHILICVYHIFRVYIHQKEKKERKNEKEIAFEQRKLNNR